MSILACWPFDWSCSGFAFCAVIGFAWLAWSIGSVAGQVVDAAKDALDDETVREIGKGVLRSWWDSLFDD